MKIERSNAVPQRDEITFQLYILSMSHPVLGLCGVEGKDVWEVTISGVLLPIESDVGFTRELYDDVVISINGQELEASLLDSLHVGNETLEEYAIERLLGMRDL